ncbi:heavy-metal-associated domain-containing protein [Flavobacterium aquicola]|uniref:Copper chaperone CopZ n=1 Tax=Flavobacterium aquicola TaxID=1682742 RepID=A0A3E0ES06_9FLAO|nr:cation transporter [Flavobacterium aquicola]REH00441.1 copper chaperone CopZ [Flavobacterium aquicola]
MKTNIQKNSNGNMIKNVFLILLMTVFTFSAQGQEKKSKNTKYTTEVNGNCEQCQKRIQKAAYSVAGVKSASWDVATHQLSLIINEEKCSLMDVKKAVAKVGHDTDSVKATKEDYDNLHSCCQYDRL